MRVVVTSQFPPSLKSSQGPVFSDSHIKTPYPVSLVGGLFSHRNKQHPFESKGHSKCHPIKLKPLIIRSTQEDTFPHLHYSSWWVIHYQPEAYPNTLSMVLPPLNPTSYSPVPILISHSGRHNPVLQNL